MAIGTDIPPNIAAPLNDHEKRLRALENPMSPVRAYMSAATTAADLGDPLTYRGRFVILTALNTVAWSTGAAWIRQDTQGALT